MKHDMVLIPSGSFIRGSYDSEDEQPLHRVAMSPFYIGRFPVTNAQFHEFIDAGGYSRPEFWSSKGWRWRETTNITHPNYWSDPIWNQLDTPVTGISWFEADAYAKFRQASLPSEAQWEYAAKGSSSRRYPWCFSW